MKTCGEVRSGAEVRQLGRSEWEASFRLFADCNYQQEWNYGEALAKRQSSTHEAVGIWNKNRLIGIASLRIRKVPYLPLGVAYIAGGPLVGRERDGDLERFQAVLIALRDEYVARRGLALRILAPIGSNEWNRNASSALTQAGFEAKHEARRYRSLVVDLCRPLTEIRKGFDQKWRNCLNRSEQQELRVLWSRNSQEFTIFERLHHDFVSKMSLEVNLDASFYGEIFGSQETDVGLVVALAMKDGNVVAGHLGSYLGDTAVYLLGFTTEQGRKVNAAYLLQWAVVERARNLGMRYYDLGGIDPVRNPGVYHFKAGMRGSDVEAAGPMEMCPDGIRRQLLTWLEACRAKRRYSA